MKRINKFINNIFFLKNAPKVFERNYLDINSSKSYQSYCKDLHQIDIPCWNTLSLKQRNFLEDQLAKSSPQRVLDIGSGNGVLLQYLAKKYNFSAIGIDFAISPKDTKSVTYLKGQFLEYQFDSKFDVIISIDSFYMINNYKKYFKKLLKLLHEKGRIIIHFTLTVESFEESKIRKALKSLSLKYELVNFTQDDEDFWNNSLELLDQYNESFVDEGYFKLWNIKKMEADKNIQLHNSNNTSRLALIVERG